MARNKPLLLLALLMSATPALAAESFDDYLDGVLDEIEPSVTIKKHENRIEEEYRVNNNLYMVKIQPSAGPAYFLVDPNGTGEMELRRNSLGMDVRPPQWSLLRW